MQHGLIRCLQEHTTGFFPTVAQFRKFCDVGQGRDGSLTAWSEAVRIVKTKGAYWSVEFADVYTAEAIRRTAGSWPAFCERLGEDLNSYESNQLRREFQNNYEEAKALAAQGYELDRICIGRADGTNRATLGKDTVAKNLVRVQNGRTVALPPPSQKTMPELPPPPTPKVDREEARQRLRSLLAEYKNSDEYKYKAKRPLTAAEQDSRRQRASEVREKLEELSILKKGAA